MNPRAVAILTASLSKTGSFLGERARTNVDESCGTDNDPSTIEASRAIRLGRLRSYVRIVRHELHVRRNRWGLRTFDRVPRLAASRLFRPWPNQHTRKQWTDVVRNFQPHPYLADRELLLPRSICARPYRRRNSAVRAFVRCRSFTHTQSLQGTIVTSGFQTTGSAGNVALWSRRLSNSCIIERKVSVSLAQ